MRLALIGLATAIAALTAGVPSGSAQHVSGYCTEGGGDNSSGLPDCSYNTGSNAAPLPADLPAIVRKIPTISRAQQRAVAMSLGEKSGIGIISSRKT